MPRCLFGQGIQRPRAAGLGTARTKGAGRIHRLTGEPRARLRRGLLAAYAYYRDNEAMMDNVLRDRQLGVPVDEGFLRHRAAAKAVLAESFAASGAAAR